ncbi:MAG: murein biosynthesis integral membrane protein MurJ [Nitrospirae bacterium]|nr:MAG: murein biosynthesis integral membrane protein MurJ [Nitrospirota bacterium]
MDQKGKIARAAGIMSVATFISRVLGYVKDMILAVFFGATGLSDTFFAAFRIPNLLRELFAEGSMSSAFIPVLTEYRQKKGEEEARDLVRTTFTVIIIVVGLVCVAGIFFSPAIVAALAPGFLAFPEKFAMTVLLTRIMFPFLLFISLASLVMGALNTKKIFFIPTLAPAMLNITIIVVVVFFASRFSHPIIAVASGVVIGGFVQFAFQLPSFFRSGYRLGLDPDFRHPGLRRMAVLLVPATMALAVNQVNIIVSNVLASYLPEGSITYLYYAMRLIQFPVGIFGVAMGMAVLPALSEHAVRGDLERLREDFSFSLRLLFFIAVPSMAGLIALREPIVNLLFQRGQFDYAATRGTAEALLFYSLGIWSIVGVRIITATFYSMQDTRTPVKIAAVGMASNLLLSLLLMGPLRHSGLALANSLASGINFFLLAYFLRRKLGRIDATRIALSFGRTAAASLVMGLSGWLLLHGALWQKSGQSGPKALFLTLTVLACISAFLAVSYLLKSEELRYLKEMIAGRLKKRPA